MPATKTLITRPASGWNVQRVTTHPGEMLLEEFLKPHRLSVAETARRIHVPAQQLYDIVQQRKPMTADIALRVEQMFGMTADFWLRLQHSHDLSKARLASGKAISKAIKRFDTRTMADAA